MVILMNREPPMSTLKTAKRGLGTVRYGPGNRAKYHVQQPSDTCQRKDDNTQAKDTIL